MTSKRKKLFVLILLVVMVVTFTAIPFHNASAQFVNFGGYLVDVDYTTCSCGFIIFYVYDINKKLTYAIIWPYVLQVLERLGVDLGIFGGVIPRLYDYGVIIPGYEVNVVGNFVPISGGASCLVISTTGCSPVTGFTGYLIGMGTSIYPSAQF